MIFNFELKPLKDVAPWGKPGEESLHWFGLTEGAYWLSLGDVELLRYSDYMAHIDGNVPEKWDLYCDYYVVRLYEDLMEMLPYVLEPMPKTLIPYICGDAGLRFEKRFSNWCDEFDGHVDNDEFDRVVENSCFWIGKRTLDTTYLSPSAHIRLWSNDEFVTVYWDNRNKNKDGAPVWSALYGQKSIPRQAFIDEVKSFHARFMESMGARVDAVLRGQLPKNIAIDMPGLTKEHEKRCIWSERIVDDQPVPTDWESIANSIARVEREMANVST